MKNKTLTNNAKYIEVFLLTILLLITYTLYLGSYPLFNPDESRYAEISREMLISGNFITPHLNGINFLDKPILIYWLEAFIIKLFNINEWAIRFWSSLFGVLGCLLVYYSTFKLFNRKIAFLSTLILATFPLYFGIAHYATLDSALTFFITSALLFLLLSSETSHSKRQYIYVMIFYVSCALAVLTKGLIGVVIPFIIIFIWILLLKNGEILKKLYLMHGSVIFFTLVLPWFILVQNKNPQFFYQFFVIQHFSRFFSQMNFNNETGLFFYLLILSSIGIPWSFFVIQAIHSNIKQVWNNPQKFKIELFLLIWVFTVLIFFSIPKSKTISRIIPLIPPLTILLGIYWNKILLKKTSYISLFSGVICHCVFNALTGMALVIASYHSLFTQYQYIARITGIFFICLAFLLFFLFKQKKIIHIYLTYVISNFILLIFFTAHASISNTQSIKPLAFSLKNKITAQDEIVGYYRYFYDLPIYLQQKETVVLDWQHNKIPFFDNWKRELWMNKSFQDKEDWLISEELFWQRWHSNKRLFVFLDDVQAIRFYRRYKKFDSYPNGNKIIVVDKYQKITVVTNKLLG